MPQASRDFFAQANTRYAAHISELKVSHPKDEYHHIRDQALQDIAPPVMTFNVK
jgi:hypothetical protein